MKAVIRLEMIGVMAGERYRALMGRNQSKPWVAQLRGLDATYGFAREFIRGEIDYSNASSTGARGIYAYYALDPGIYEINKRLSWKHAKRYFIRVKDDTEIEEISKEEAIACLTNVCSASTS